MNTKRVLAIMFLNTLSEAIGLISSQMALQEIADQAHEKQQRKLERLKNSGLPEYAQEMFIPQGGKKPDRDS